MEERRQGGGNTEKCAQDGEKEIEKESRKSHTETE